MYSYVPSQCFANVINRNPFNTGECREIPACTEDELEDFPRRMREWLFNVMRELAERDELSPHYKQLEKEAQGKGVQRGETEFVCG